MDQFVKGACFLTIVNVGVLPLNSPGDFLKIAAMISLSVGVDVVGVSSSDEASLPTAGLGLASCPDVVVGCELKATATQTLIPRMIITAISIFFIQLTPYLHHLGYVYRYEGGHTNLQRTCSH